MPKLTLRFFELDLLVVDGKVERCRVSTTLPSGHVQHVGYEQPPKLPPKPAPRKRTRKGGR